MDCLKTVSESQKNLILKVFTAMTDNISNGFYEPESDNLAKDWLKKNKLMPYIGDQWIQTDVCTPVVHSSTGEKLADVSLATEENFLSAYNVALKAFNGWKTNHNGRAAALLNIAQILESQKQLFSLLESISTGKLVRHVRALDIPLLVKSFRYAAHLAASWDLQMGSWSPLGVVYIIASGFNYPAISLCWQVATALGMGNTVILQVDPQSCLSAAFLSHILSKSGLGEGVFNLLPQTPSFLCNLSISSLQGLKKIFFSGLYEDAEKLRHWSASAKLEFELHIHAAFQRPTAVILQDADIDSAVSGTLQMFCCGDARSKSAGCRVLVQDSIKEKFTRKLQSKFQELKVGSCLSNADISSVLFGDTEHYFTPEEIEAAGVEVVRLSDCTPSGSVCLIDKLQTSSTIAHKKVCGRYLILLSFRTLKEAITICNHEKSGCDISIWCEKITAALHIAHALKTANVWINGQNIFDCAASYGSVYTSGDGISSGPMAVFDFVEQNVENRKDDSPDSISLSTEGSKKSLNRTFKMFSGGSFKFSDGSTLRAVCDGSNEEVYHVPDGSRKDIRNAVECALSAQVKWHMRTAFSRAQVLFSAAKALKSAAQTFYNLLYETTPYSREECAVEVGMSLKRLRYWATMKNMYSGSLEETELCGKVMRTHEPLGVIGVVCPDEFPLLATVSLIAPVIATGNAVVVIPSEKYPALALQLCEIFQKCGLPDGVLNVITGSSKILATVLSSHMEVEAVWMHKNCEDCIAAAKNAVVRKKKVWICKNQDWKCIPHDNGIEFILRSTYIKTVWVPVGDIFAN